MEPRDYPPKEKRGPDLAVLSVLSGLFGLLSLCFFLGFPGAIICGAAAVGFSVLSRNLAENGNGRFTRTASVGMFFGVSAILLGIAEFGYLMYFNRLLRDPEMANYISELYSQYQEILNR